MLSSRKICIYCKKEILWFPVAPDGREIPVNATPYPKGALTQDATTGLLVKVFPSNSNSAPRYRSHLLDCKPLAKALYSAKTINIGNDSCGVPTCSFQGSHSHIYCCNCGEPGHLAKDCEDELLAKELYFE